MDCLFTFLLNKQLKNVSKNILKTHRKKHYGKKNFFQKNSLSFIAVVFVIFTVVFTNMTANTTATTAMDTLNVGFRIPKLWQTLNRFARSFHQEQTSYF